VEADEEKWSDSEEDEEAIAAAKAQEVAERASYKFFRPSPGSALGPRQ